MKRHLYNALLLFFCCVAGFQCTKKHPIPDPVPVQTGTLKFNIQTDINSARLVLHTSKYVNANNDSFKVSTLKYYISNITLKNSDGLYKVPDSYYLIDASISTDTIINISNIPVGTYTEIGFSLGVDSINNHTGSQPAALNPTIAADMFWLWAPGYKFIELEGYHGTNYASGMLFHISGDDNYKKWLMNSSTANWANINIKNNTSSTIMLKANIDEMFKTPVTINFATMNNVSADPDAHTIANNYADMFQLSAIVNP
jgi:hypothetical protein